MAKKTKPQQNAEAPQTIQEPEVAQEVETETTQESPQTVQAPQPTVHSEFTGGAFANFFINLAAKFVMLITLGILYPFMVTWKEKWMAKHTYINGKQLVFDGNGFQFWGRYMLWWLLSVVTLGIYYIGFMSIGVTKWRTKHLHFVDTPAEQRESYFDGRWYQLLGVKLLSTLVVIETLFIAALWSVCFKQRWTCSHQVIDGQRLNFNGGGLQLFGKYMLWLLLTIITIGIYIFWMTISIKKWVIYHTNNNGTKPEEKKDIDTVRDYLGLLVCFIFLIAFGVSQAFTGPEGRVVQTMFAMALYIVGPLYLLSGVFRWFKIKNKGISTTPAVAMMAVGWLFMIISVFIKLFAVV